jgi:hypothetical protein
MDPIEHVDRRRAGRFAGDARAETEARELRVEIGGVLKADTHGRAKLSRCGKKADDPPHTLVAAGPPESRVRGDEEPRVLRGSLPLEVPPFIRKEADRLLVELPYPIPHNRRAYISEAG